MNDQHRPFLAVLFYGYFLLKITASKTTSYLQRLHVWIALPELRRAVVDGDDQKATRFYDGNPFAKGCKRVFEVVENFVQDYGFNFPFSAPIFGAGAKKLTQRILVLGCVNSNGVRVNSPVTILAVGKQQSVATPHINNSKAIFQQFPNYLIPRWLVHVWSAVKKCLSGQGCGRSHAALYGFIVLLSIGQTLTGAVINVPSDRATPILAAAVTASGDTVYVSGGPYLGWTETAAGVNWVGINNPEITSMILLSGGQCIVTGFTVDMGLDDSFGDSCIEITSGGNQVYLNTLRGFLDKAVYINSSDTNVVMFNTCTDVYGDEGVSGGSAIIVCRGDDNLVAYNPMHDANIDFIGYAGDRNRFVCNSGRNSNTNSSAHPDMFQTGGVGHSLGGNDTVKMRNYHEDSIYPAVHHHGHNTEDNSVGFFRDLNYGNVYVRIGNGVGAWFQTWNGIYIENEGYFGAHRQFEGEDFAVELTAQQAFFATTPTSNMRVHNCLFIDVSGPNATSVRVYVMDGTGLAANFNHAWDTRGTPTYATPFTSEANEITTDPLLVNYAADDFRLTASSPGRATGGAVTTVSSVSGTGTSFDVADGGFFRGTNVWMRGFGHGLKITVGTDQVQVDSVSGNTLTFTPSITYAQNDAVYLGWSATPDRGPYPFGHVRLSAATHNGTTVTVTGDAEFVVAFTSGVPAAIDRTAPYEFPGLTGTIVYVAATAYASPTPFIIASAGLSSDVLYRNRGKATRSAGVIP